MQSADYAGKRPLVWVHQESLSPYSVALQAAPDAPAVWIWDDAALERQRWTLKRLVFLSECLAELPVEIYRGPTQATMQQLLKQHQRSGVITTVTPDPSLKQHIDQLEAERPVAVLPEPGLLSREMNLPLSRFSNYWRKAQQYAFGR